MKRPLIAIVMGSDSDLPVMEEAAKILDEYGIKNSVSILSAHRTPDDVALFAKKARSRGYKVIIAGAGGAAHLAGVIASHTTLPVIGVPMATKELGGLDSLLSTVQMPSGVPVASFAIGAAGAKNAAIFAMQVLGLTDEKLVAKLDAFKRSLAGKVREKNSALSRKKK